VSTLAFIPVKNCERWLGAFLPQLEALEDVSQIIFSYGASQDNTLEFIKQYRKASRTPVKIKADPEMGQVYSSAQIGLLYSDLQRVMQETPDDYPETHVALLDADVMRMPKTLIKTLKKHKKPIVAPYIWTLFHTEPCKLFYDTMVFRKDGFRFHPFDPPMNQGKLLEVDSVGTTFLVEKECFLDVPYGDPYPHMKFCNDAREKGYTVWADPRTDVYHVDLIRFGAFHHELDVIKAMVRKDANPLQFADESSYMRNDGGVSTPYELGAEYHRLYTFGVMR
jgi:hypothetical protein